MATDDCHVYSYGFWGNSWASAPWAYAHPWATTQLTYPRPLPRGQGMGKGDTFTTVTLFWGVARCGSASLGKARGESPKETIGSLQALPLRCSIPHRCPENPNYSTFKCKTLPQHPVVMCFFFESLWCCRQHAQLLLSLGRCGAISGAHSACHYSDAMVPSLARTARRTILYSASLSRISLRQRQARHLYCQERSMRYCSRGRAPEHSRSTIPRSRVGHLQVHHLY